jgi:hypothetical protein
VTVISLSTYRKLAYEMEYMGLIVMDLGLVAAFVNKAV